MQSDFKHINVVPIGNEFFDLTPLSRVSDKGFKLNRLRKHYTRQVNKTQHTFHNKLSTILNDFPLLNDIHPLYIDLLRFVFDKKRYNFSLGQVATSIYLITNIANDYTNLLEFSGSVKECKALKTSAVSGMFSVVNEITPSLAYLEQLRQHMVKLPLVDSNVPTILVCGYPHVDKIFFVNRVVGFVTKSVAFDVGHAGYGGLRYQVIDAPGVLDKPVFGECNVVIDALSRHVRDAIVLFFLDVSCECGYSIADQVVFFHSVKGVFVNRPLLIVCDESDLMEVNEEDWKLILEMSDVMGEEVGLKIGDMKSEEGVVSVKNVACERLLDQRERLSCIAQEEARILRNKYIVAYQEWKDDISPQELDDDRQVSDVLFKVEELEHGGEQPGEEKEEEDYDHRKVSDVLFKPKELEHERVKQSEEEQEDDFVMADERFREEHKDEVVAIRKIKPLRILIIVSFFIIVGNAYGAVQQCLSTLSF